MSRRDVLRFGATVVCGGLLVCGTMAGAAPMPAPEPSMRAVPPIPSRNLTKVRAQLTATLAPVTRVRLRSILVSRIDQATARLDRPPPDRSFEARLLVFREALDAFFAGVAALRKEPGAAAERKQLDAVIQETIATLPAGDPVGPILEGMLGPGAVVTTPQTLARALGELRELAGSVAARPDAGSAGFVTLEGPKLDEEAKRQEAYLAKVLADARRSPPALTTAERRLVASMTALRTLLGELKAGLGPMPSEKPPRSVEAPDAGAD